MEEKYGRTAGKFVVYFFVIFYVFASSVIMGTPSHAEDKEILIGSVLPLTGKQAKPGRLFKMGYDLAFKQQNEKGGIYLKDIKKKIPTKLVIYDDKTNPTVSAGMAERLATVDKIDAFLGGYTTPLGEAQAIIPEKYGIPYVTGGTASKPLFKPTNKWIFGTLSSVETLSATIMDWLKLEQDAKRLPKPAKIALIWQNTDHGREYRDGVQTWIKEKPGLFEIALNEPFENMGKEHTPIIIKVKQARADVFLSDAYEPDYILQHRAYVEQGLNHKVVNYGARGPEKSAREALGDYVDYNVAALWWSPMLPYPQSKKLMADFYAEYKEDLTEWYGALGYDTARVLFKAFEDAGSTNKEKVRQALLKMVMSGSVIPKQTIFFPKSNNYQI
ncbi:amino acid ABC transporter substrate-binding protein, partial [Candidatus Woesearchaeota archaeon]|nr:amino acid ABC transporter substrate-binding protein [Candidatus Woesearchaeota archaeon]